MKEQPVSSKYAKTPRREPIRREPITADGTRKEAEPRPKTRRRIRKFVERRRGKLDEFAK